MYKTLNKLFNKLSLVALATFLPLVNFAQGTTPPATTAVVCSRKIGNLRELFQFPVCIINRYVIPLMITIAIAMFIFGIVRYIAKAENQAEHKKMRDFILWSLLAIFIILSVWAILYFVANSLQLGQ